MAAIQIGQNGLHDLLEKVAHHLDVLQGEVDVGDLVGEEGVDENQQLIQ